MSAIPRIILENIASERVLELARAFELSGLAGLFRNDSVTTVAHRPEVATGSCQDVASDSGNSTGFRSVRAFSNASVHRNPIIQREWLHEDGP